VKNFLILIMFIFIVRTSLGQSKPIDYELAIGFVPSFISASELIITAKGDSGFLNIRIYKNYKTKETSIECKTTIPSSGLMALTNFLKTYKFQIKSSIDTVGCHKEFVHGDSVLVYDINVGSDGIDVKGIFTQNSTMKKFAFWSPENGTKNADLMVVVFNLLDNAFTDQKLINYFERLEQYFPHKLGLKKLSDHPLTYKLFGDISEREEDELNNFLEHLPTHRKIIIDLSNLSGMGTMFYDEFNQYCANNRNIYWLNPSSRCLIVLSKIGIPNRQIISKKGP